MALCKVEVSQPLYLRSSGLWPIKCYPWRYGITTHMCEPTNCPRSSLRTESSSTQTPSKTKTCSGPSGVEVPVTSAS